MATIPHTAEAQLSSTADFDFVFVTDTVPRGAHARHQCSERTAEPNPSGFDAASLNAFHEEFKSLVLEGGESSQVDVLAETFVEIFDSYELEEEVAEEVAPQRASSSTIVMVPVKPATPRQIVRPMAGPRLGTPMPIETWVVKVIAVLVFFNLLFAGLIISGMRVRDLFN